MHHSHSSHQKTSSNFVRITLKGRLGVKNELSLEGATCMYIKTYGKILGDPGDFFFFFLSANFSKGWWFQTRQLTMLLEITLAFNVFIELWQQSKIQINKVTIYCKFSNTKILPKLTLPTCSYYRNYKSLFLLNFWHTKWK